MTRSSLNLVVPPAPPRMDVIETLHGVQVADPFRSFEESDTAGVLNWVESQRIRTRIALDALPLRSEAEASLRSVWAYPHSGMPIRRGKRGFEWRYNGVQPQGVWWIEEEGESRLLLDPNAWTPDGSTHIGAFAPSPDGSRVVYGRHVNGSDWSALHVIDVASGRELPDRIEQTRWGGLAWLPDGTAFLYSHHLPGDMDRELVRLHRIGEHRDPDPTVFDPQGRTPCFVTCAELPGRAGAICYASLGADRKAGCWLVEPDARTVRPISPIGFSEISACLREGGVLFAITDHLADRRRLVAIDVANPDPGAWRTIVPETEDVLTDAAFASGNWVLLYAAHGWNRLEIRNRHGGCPRRIETAHISRIWYRTPEPDDREILFVEDSLAKPPTQYALDIATGSAELRRRSRARVDLSHCVLKQTFVMARDGARVPLTLIHRPDVILDGTARACLSSYGGYGHTATRGFSFMVHHWVENGGVFAFAGIRGGGEEGEAWHRAAVGTRRQVSFNDFQDCAEWLHRENYCSPQTLGIHGSSNGGLLVAVCHVAASRSVRRGTL
jgi:prolyl oligopeptidase